MIVIRLLARFIIVPTGALAAMCAVILVVMVSDWNRFNTLAARSSFTDDAALAVLFVGTLFSLFASVVALTMLMPAALGVALAEAFAFRSWMFHVANGAFAAGVGMLTTQESQKATGLYYGEPVVMLAAGIVAGFVYWAVAGWSAGFWKPIFAPPEKENRLSEERR